MASLVLNGSTSGSITISSPAVSGSNTLTLPASTGTVILSDASANLQFNSGYGSVATAYGCRAWVNFNGTSTVSIRASGNVTSITDNGTGDYTVNFTTAMPDANYAWSGSATNAANSNIVMGQNAPTAPTASALRINTAQAAVAIADMQYVSISVFR